MKEGGLPRLQTLSLSRGGPKPPTTFAPRNNRWNDLGALQRTAGNAAVCRIVGAKVSAQGPSSVNSQVSIQRKVGFEFETFWELAATDQKGPPGAVGVTEKPVPIKKTLGKGKGWTLHADSNQKPVAEFVTDPIEEPEIVDLWLATAALETGVDNLLGSTFVPGRNGEWAKIKSFPGEGVDLWIQKGDVEVKAAPQMTAGFRLDRLPKLMQLMGRRHEKGAQQLLNKPQGEGAEKIAGLLRKAARRAEIFCRTDDVTTPLGTFPRPKPLDADFQGAIALLGAYALLGSEHAPLSYAKELSPLMSRTNLGFLPANVRSNPALGEGVQFVAELSALDDKLFRNGFDVKGVPTAAEAGKRVDHVEYLGPTVRAWLGAISAGNDPLQALSDGDMSNLDRLEGVETKLGAGPLTHGAQGLIVELRGMQEELPYKAWAKLAEELFAFVG